MAQRTPTLPHQGQSKMPEKTPFIVHCGGHARDHAANSNTASLPSSWPRPAASHQLGKLAGAIDAVTPSQPSSDDTRTRVETGHVHSKTVDKCQ